MHAERVNGYDPLAVIDAVTRKKELLVDGKGPALLDVVTYRVSRTLTVRQLDIPYTRRRSRRGRLRIRSPHIKEKLIKRQDRNR